MRAGLRPLSNDWIEGLTELWGDPAVIRYTNIPRPCGPAEAAERLGLLLSCQAELAVPTIFAVEEDGRFRGVAGCPPIDVSQRTFGLFYQLLPAAWGRGLGYAAARLALEALEEGWRSPTVYADVVAENAASIRILERLGFRRTGARPEAFCRDGWRGDILDYVRRPGGEKEERT